MLKRILFFLTLTVSLQGLASGIETKLSTDNISQGDSFTLSFIQHEKTNGVTPDFSVLEKDFNILSNNYGSNFQSINGFMSAEVFWQLTLAAKNTGQLTIPAIRFGNATSNSLTIYVSEKKIKKNVPPIGPVLLKAEVSPLTPYVQSQIIYTLKMYYQTRLDNISIEIPQNKDLTFVDLGKEKSYQTTLNGKPYAVIEKQLALFAKNAGEIRIPSSRLTAVTYDATNNFNGFLISTPRPISVETNPIRIKVRPVPHQFKDATWLPSPQVTITEKWSSDTMQWQLGDPVTRTLIVEAVGLRADQIPDLDIQKMLEAHVYIDTPKRENKMDNHQLVGRLEQTVTYIMNAPRTFKIPAVKLAWWNTQTDMPVIAEVKALSINVVGTSRQIANPTPAATLQTQPATPAINKLNFNSTRSFIRSNVWLWPILFALLIVLKILLSWKKRSSISLLENHQHAEVNISEKMFISACQQGDARTSLAYLLQKKISDETLSEAIADLQKTLYAKKPTPWTGRVLLEAYQVWKLKSSEPLRSTIDPLPPLNPS